MDCCTSKQENKSVDENEKLKGGKMDKKIIMWIIIAILVIAVIFITIKTTNLGATGQVVSSASQAASSSSGMVGGC